MLLLYRRKKMKKIGIIYGGRSTEHDASIKSKENICENLEEFEIVDIIFIDRNGLIFKNDKLVSLGKFVNYLSNKKDVFYINLLHGTEGEDGEWSGLIDIANVNGSFENVLTSSLLMNKYEQSIIVKHEVKNIFIPNSVIIHSFDSENIVFEKIFSLKTENIILKPNSMGASHFTFHYNGINKEFIINSLNKIFQYDDNAIVQEFIEGEEFTCGAYNSFDNCNVLPIIHVKASHQDFLDHKTKHNKNMSKIDFNKFSEQTKIEDVVMNLFKIFNIQVMCRFDFIVSKGKIYYLEGNVIPGFSKGSAFPMMLNKANISLNDFLKDIIKYKTSLRKKIKFLPYVISD
ncbi:MAG: hypothetical protein EOM55_01995 [Clostridia bacterium]|nr:hypothetical protein [Clostridia bacterium]